MANTISDCLSLAKFAGIRGPLTITRCDQITDHAADITLLRGVVVRPGVVPCYRHRPGLMPVVQLLEKACSISDVL